MKRTLSIPLYFMALVITLGIFAIGIYVGTVINTANLSGVQNNLDEVTRGVSSLELLLLLEKDSPFFCSVYLDELNRINTDTERIGQQLTLLEGKGVTNVELKRRFFLLEMNSYLLSQRVNAQCAHNITLVLYFYSNEECAQCAEQGVQLTEARRQIENVHTYTFDGSLQSPIVEALEAKYNITSYPTIVINDRTFEGFIDASHLRAEIR